MIGIHDLIPKEEGLVGILLVLSDLLDRADGDETGEEEDGAGHQQPGIECGLRKANFLFKIIHTVIGPGL